MAGNRPPNVESKKKPVWGDLVATQARLLPGTIVSVIGPTASATGLPGSKASVPGTAASHRRRAASPLPPRKARAVPSSRGRTSLRPLREIHVERPAAVPSHPRLPADRLHHDHRAAPTSTAPRGVAGTRQSRGAPTGPGVAGLDTPEAAMMQCRQFRRRSFSPQLRNTAHTKEETHGRTGHPARSHEAAGHDDRGRGRQRRLARDAQGRGGAAEIHRRRATSRALRSRPGT